MSSDRAERSEGDKGAPLADALRVLRDRWLLVVAVVVVCTGGALALSLSSQKQYQATSELLFRPNQLGQAVLGTTLVSGSVDPTRDSATNQGLVHSSEVAQSVANRTKLGLSASQLLDKVSVQSAENSDLIQIKATDTSPRRAAQIANGFASGYVAFAQQQAQNRITQGEQLLRQRLSALPPGADADRRQLQDALQKLLALEAVQTGDAQVADRASVPSSASSPLPKRDAVLGAVFGLILGVALVFLLDALDRRIKTPEDFEREYGLRSLVNIPQASFRARTPQTRGPAFEPYRILRSSLAFASVDREVRMLLVTSAVLGEGKTTVAVNLGRAAALSGEQVVLVEADLRRPSFHEHFPIELGSGGLTNAVIGGGSAREFIQYDVLGIPNLGVLPSGPLPPSSAEILRSTSMGTVLSELTETASLVIIDAPPLLPVADAQILLDRPEIDSCLVVARAYFTKRDQARRTRTLLEQHRVTPLGVVVTGLRDMHTYEYYGSSSSRGELLSPGENGSRADRRRLRREAKSQ
jgi:capsular exopolysaccharide synthesis family protein